MHCLTFFPMRSVAAAEKGVKAYSKMALLLEKLQIQRNGDANDVSSLH